MKYVAALDVQAPVILQGNVGGRGPAGRHNPYVIVYDNIYIYINIYT